MKIIRFCSLALIASVLPATIVLAASTSSQFLSNIVPNLKMTLKSEGEADFKINLDVRLPLPNTYRKDLCILPAYSLKTSEGEGKLFEYDRSDVNKSVPWNVGLSLGLITRPDMTAKPDQNQKSPENSNRLTFPEEESLRYCYDRYLAGEKNDFHNWLTKVKPEYYEGWINKKAERIKPDDLCSSQRKKISGASEDGSDAPTMSQALTACFEEYNKDPEHSTWKLGRTLKNEWDKYFINTIVERGDFDESSLCSQGVQILTDLSSLVEYRYPFPASIISLGASTGQKKFEYIDWTDDDPKKYSDVDDRIEWPGEIGFHWAKNIYINNWRWRAYTWTLEALGTYEWAWEASAKTANYCEETQKIDRDGNLVSSDKCKALPFGEPQRNEIITLNFLPLGMSDRIWYRWRWSAGPGAKYRVTGEEPDRWAFNFQAPFRFNFATVPESYRIEYKGILELSPEVKYTYHEHKTDEWQYLISLSILGQRSLFSVLYNER